MWKASVSFRYGDYSVHVHFAVGGRSKREAEQRAAAIATERIMRGPNEHANSFVLYSVTKIEQGDILAEPASFGPDGKPIHRAW